MPEEQQIDPQTGSGPAGVNPSEIDKLIKDMEESTRALDEASAKFTAETADIVQKINDEPEIPDNAPEQDLADDAEIAAFESEIDGDMNSAILDLATKNESNLN